MHFRQIISLSLFLLFAIAASTLANELHVSIVVNDTCTPIDFTECVPCIDYSGETAFYKAFTYVAGGGGELGFYSNKFTDPSCLNFVEYSPSVYDHCNPVYSVENCDIYGGDTEVNAYQITLSSQVPIIVTASEQIYLKLSQYKVTIEGRVFNGAVRINEYNAENRNSSLNFYRLNDTTIFSSMGLLSYGETYEYGNFSFVVEQITQDFPLPITSNNQFITFNPYSSAAVTTGDTYNLFKRYDFDIIQVYTDSSYNLNGLELSDIRRNSISDLSLDPSSGTLHYTAQVPLSTFCSSKVGKIEDYTLTTFDCNL